MLDVSQILQRQRQAVQDWHDEPGQLTQLNPAAMVDVHALILEQHAFNFRLWHEEDQARCPQASDQVIARVKRAIDKLNQQRNDWIEKIDVWILRDLESRGIRSIADATQNTETPGSAIDRLSIMALRIYHLIEQSQRGDASSELLANIQDKIDRCQRQLQDLSQSLGELLHDIYAGQKRHELYCQMKMYNDPTLNPYLYKSARKAG